SDGTIAWRKLATGADSTTITRALLPDNLDERLCNLDGRGIDVSSDQSLLNHIRTITGLPNSAMPAGRSPRAGSTPAARGEMRRVSRQRECRLSAVPLLIAGLSTA